MGITAIMRRMRSIVLLGLFIAVMSGLPDTLSEPQTSPESPPSPRLRRASRAPSTDSEALRVLFIGNSLTSFNDLPRLVERIADAGGKVRIRSKSVTANDFSLEDHWNGGSAQKAIRRGPLDWVILQQGPSSQPDSQVLLRDYVERFDRVIREANAKTALYMVWPSRARYRDMAGVITSYTNAAKSVEGTLLPAGLAWHLGFQREPELPLYGEDQFHPSRLGSYLAALVIYEGLTGEPTEGLPPAVRDRTLTPPRLHLLTDIAHQAVTAKRP